MKNVFLLSYYNLASHIRTCLLYLSMFPEDYEINKRQLIWMWIAEGFILEKQGRSLFEVGESYYNELINISLIQPMYFMDTTVVSSCHVHDVVLDLISSLSSEENFITTLNDVGHASMSQKIRRLFLQNGMVNEGMDGSTVSMHQVRSLAAFSSAVNLIPALSRFEVVRVLHLENCDLSHGYYNLKYIGKLVHLRFLGLRSTRIVHLPEEIGSLQFLQVLDISDNAISTLPFTIVQLRQLKCLYIDQNVTAENRIGGLTSLEEVRLAFKVSHGQYSNGIIQELGCLTKLRVLDINVCFRTEEPNVLVECLHKLQHIQNLSIGFQNGAGNLDLLVGPQSLRSLEIDADYMFSRLPVWIKHSHVQNLSFLRIGVRGIQQQDIENFGRLPALRDLVMSFPGAYSSKISREFVISAGLFPCLLHFKLQGYDGRVVFEQGAMPRLKSLDLRIHRAVWSKWTGIPDLGFENLPSLLHLHVDLGNILILPALTKEARAALRNMAEMHPNHPSISTIG